MKFLSSLRRMLAHKTRDSRRTSPEEAPDTQAHSEDDDAEAQAPEQDAWTDDENPFAEPVRLEIRDVFDLHTIAPRDVRSVVEEYLYQAQLAGYRSVRIIHGKGVGVQRELVRSILARTPFVTSFADAPPEAGGWGATIARLSPAPEREDA